MTNLVNEIVIKSVADLIADAPHESWSIDQHVVTESEETYWILSNPDFPHKVFVYLIQGVLEDDEIDDFNEDFVEIAPLDGFVLSFCDDNNPYGTDDWDGTRIAISTRGQHKYHTIPYGEYISWELCGFPEFLVADYMSENNFRIAPKDYDRALQVMREYNMVRDPDESNACTELSQESPFRALPTL